MPRQARRRSLLLTAVLLTATAGCVPVAWLPDSSGFVHTAFREGGKEGFRLMHYDVNKKQLRVVVANMPAATGWPALSPDGKQVAVARLVAGKDKPMQVIIYDLEGREVRRSPEFAWGPTRNEPLLLTGVFWAGDKILVHDFEDMQPGDLGGKMKPATTGIYDLKKNTMIIVEGRPAAFAGTPLRPDGKDFLITKPTTWIEDGRNGLTIGMALVDWQGKVQVIDMDQVRKAELSGDQRQLVEMPWAGTSRWHGNIAEVTSGTVRLQIDTDKRSGTCAKIPDAQAKVNGADIIQQFTFPDSKVQVRVLSKGTGVNNQRLELVKAGEPILLNQSKGWVLSPSPNGKWLAIRGFPGHGSGDGGIIFLVNNMGEIQQFQAIPPSKD